MNASARNTPELRKKIALVSHILPPYPSGQAITLYRLFKNVNPERCCLLSMGGHYSDRQAEACQNSLPGRHYELKPSSKALLFDKLRIRLITRLADKLPLVRSRARQIERIIHKERIGLVLACTGELYNLPAAWLAAKRAGIPFVPYIFDDFIYQWTGIFRAFAERWEPRIIADSAGIVAPNEYLRREYFIRYGKSCFVAHNPCPLPDYAELDKGKRILPPRTVNIVYTGAVYRAHYDAFRRLLHAIHAFGRQDIMLHIFTAQNEKELKKHGITGPAVTRHEHISQANVPAILRQADILFLPLAFNSPIQHVVKTSSPGKMGEYMAAGRPVLVHAPQDSFVAHYFTENKCGLVCSSASSKILAENLASLMSDGRLRGALSANARKCAELDFNMDTETARLVEYLNSLA